MFLRDITSREFFPSLYLLDVPAPVNLEKKHSFGLPANDMTLVGAIENPVRLRTSMITTSDRTITVACARNSVIDLQIHSDTGHVLDIYKRVDGIVAPQSVTWVSASLGNDEQIIEIILRIFWNIDRSKFYQCSLMVC